MRKLEDIKCMHYIYEFTLRNFIFYKDKYYLIQKMHLMDSYFILVI